MSTEHLPVFPLNVPLMPGCIMPLQIFEKRYLDMVSHCMRTNTGFVVTLLKPGSERQEVIRPNQTEEQDTLPFYNQGTLAQIVDFDQRDNGLLAITIEGKERRNLTQIDQSNSGLWQANTVTVLETGSPSGENKDVLIGLFERALSMNGNLAEKIQPKKLTTEQLMNYLIMFLPLAADLKQSLVENGDLSDRWKQLLTTLSALLDTDQSTIQ